MEILIYALIAVFFAWRLFSALGARHEGERQRPNPFAASSQSPAPEDQKNLLALPLTRPAFQSQEPLTALEPAPASLSGALYALSRAEPGFDEKTFLKGARAAFEMIVHAYAAGERDTLKPLMSPVLFEAFSGAIDARSAAGERMEMKFLNVTEAHISAARLEGRHALVTVEFTSDQARLLYAGAVVKEDEGVKRLHDIWTFRREVGAPDPNWMLVETKTA